jgi:hypothetical protein
MSFAFDVYYGGPNDASKEKRIIGEVAKFAGRLDHCDPSNGISGNCLTFDFADEKTAEKAATHIAQLGEHVEGPYDYGD